MPQTVCIIGGGIIGLSLAWLLAQQGATVTVLDAGAFGQEASHAAAGMLAPQLEAEAGEEALWPLLLRAQQAWPGFAAALTAATGQDVGYRTEGTLMVARTRDDVARVRRHQAYLERHGVVLPWLSGDEVLKREPALSPRILGAVYGGADHQVDNRAVVAALLTVLGALPKVTLRPHAPVRRLVYAGERVTGLATATETVCADATVLAAGAWLQRIDGVPDSLPMRPLKGQMLMLHSSDPTLLRHTVWGEAVYIVPRKDGRILIGATVEEQGFNKDVTHGALMNLTRAAWELVPGLYDLPVMESWAGLRPSPLDDAPILGAASCPGLYYATGHHRNGILLAPYTAEVLAQEILSGRNEPAINPFRYTRFQRIDRL